VPAPRTVSVTRYVTPLREGGSLPALVEADDGGLYVLKFSGAAHGTRALIGSLPPRGRFRWLVSPRSTVVQPGPVHTRRTHDPAACLKHVMDRMVRR
jgi:DUF3037 family protein